MEEEEKEEEEEEEDSKGVQKEDDRDDRERNGNAREIVLEKRIFFLHRLSKFQTYIFYLKENGFFEFGNARFDYVLVRRNRVNKWKRGYDRDERSSRED